MIDFSYADYAWEQTEALLAVDSPSGFTANAAQWVKNAFSGLGFDAHLTAKGGVLVDLGGEDDCRVEAEVFPAITSYTARLISFESPEAKAAGITGLDAVDSWSAGFVQGDVFRSCVVSARSVAKPKLETMVEMPVCAGEPCVMIVDIWGNRRFYLPKRRY